MPEAVDGVEDWLAESQRNERPSRAITDVHYEARASDVDLLKVKTRASVVPDASEVWIQSLLIRDGVPVNAEGIDCVDDAVEVFESGLPTSRCDA